MMPMAHEVDRRGVREEEAMDPAAEGRLVGDVRLEVPPSPADEMVADVGGAIVGRLPLGHLPRALDAPQRHAQLGLAARLGQFLHHLPVPVAALEVHAAVHRGRIALQYLLDQAHLLEVERPVEGARRTAGW